MDINVELVISEYEFPVTLNDSLGKCMLYLEFFASKSVCAYDIETDQVKLIRKLRKKLDQVVKKELLSMESEILTKNIRILGYMEHPCEKVR